MGLDIDNAAVRRLDLASFTGDAWAVQATQALPPDDGTVPRFVADGSPVRWMVVGMESGKDGAAQVADAVTSIDTLLVKINRTKRGEPVVRTLVPTSGVVVGSEFTEDDVSSGDILVFAVSSATAGGGSADWLWVIPTAGCTKLASGVVP